MALDQSTADALAQAYGQGNFDQVNSILGSGGINANDVQSYFNFNESQMADLGSAGVKFASAPTYTSTDEQGNAIYDTPAYVAPTPTPTGIATLTPTTVTPTGIASVTPTTVTPTPTTVTNPYDAITQAWINGDFGTTGSLIASSGLTPAQVKAYYG